MAAVAVIALVIEAIQNTVSGVIVGAVGELALAEGALVDDAVAGRRHGDDAGDSLASVAGRRAWSTSAISSS